MLHIIIILLSYAFINNMCYYMKMTGTDIHTVQELVESHLKDMILKHFDTKKADAIFADGEVSWLTSSAYILCINL